MTGGWITLQNAIEHNDNHVNTKTQKAANAPSISYYAVPRLPTSKSGLRDYRTPSVQNAKINAVFLAKRHSNTSVECIAVEKWSDACRLPSCKGS